MYSFNLLTVVNAADGVSTTLSDPLTRFTSLADVFGWVTNFIMALGWGLVFIYLALGFMRYVTSRGEKAETKAAQDQLTYAVIGAVGLLTIGLVIRIVRNLLGITNISSGTGGGNIIPGNL